MNNLLTQSLRTPVTEFKTSLKIFWPIFLLVPALSMLAVFTTSEYPEYLSPIGAALLIILYSLALFSQGMINWHKTITDKKKAKLISPLPGLAAFFFSIYLINFLGMMSFIAWVIRHIESYNNWYVSLISFFFSICLVSYLLVAVCKREFMSLPRIADSRKRSRELTAKIVKLTNSHKWTLDLLILLIAFEITLYIIPIFLLLTGSAESPVLLSLIALGVGLSMCYFSLVIMSYLSLSYKRMLDS